MTQATLGDFAGREPATADTPDALDQLSPIYREDYHAVAIEGVSPTDQVRERGVSVASVCRNVSEASKQVEGGDSE